MPGQHFFAAPHHAQAHKHKMDVRKAAESGSSKPIRAAETDSENAELIWRQLIERLVLEEAMKKQLCRCFIFFASFFLLMTSMYISFPSWHLNPMQRYIKDHYKLLQAENLSSVEDIMKYAETYRSEYSPLTQEKPRRARTSPIMPPLLIQERFKAEPCESYYRGVTSAILSANVNAAVHCVGEELESEKFIVDVKDEDGSTRKRETYKAFKSSLGAPKYIRTLTAHEPLSTHWIDFQTHKITLFDMFVNPKNRAGSMLELIWRQLEGGFYQYEGHMVSYQDMTEYEWNQWLLFAIISGALCLLELCLLAKIFRLRWERRQKWYNIADHSPHSMTHRQTVQREVPLFGFIDAVDIALRMCIIAYQISRYLQLYSPDASLGSFGIGIKSVLENYAKWNSEGSTESDVKFGAFYDSVEALKFQLDTDFGLRMGGYFLLLACFFRIICYLKIHPRMGTLYFTISHAMDDLAHFMIVFGLLFTVLAFTAAWMFGSYNSNFAGIPTSMFTQFRMLIGDFNVLPDNVESSSWRTRIFIIYLAIFAVMCFFILLNFFLAVILAAHAEAGEKVKLSLVEGTAWTDIWSVFTYSIRRRLNHWPSRAKLLETLLNDKNIAHRYLTDPDELIRIGKSHMLETGLFNVDNVVRFLDLYGKIEPLRTGEEREDRELDHNRMLFGFEELALIARDTPEGVSRATVTNFRKSINFKLASCIPGSPKLRKVSPLGQAGQATVDEPMGESPMPDKSISEDVSEPKSRESESRSEELLEKDPHSPECSIEDV